NIGWFDIAVEHTACMSVVNCAGNLGHEPRNGLLHSTRATVEASGRRQGITARYLRPETLAFNEVQNQEGLDFALAHLVDADDVGMVEPRGSLCLNSE